MEFTLESLLSISPSHHWALDMVPMVSTQYGATASAEMAQQQPPIPSPVSFNLTATTQHTHTFIDPAVVATTDEQFLFDFDLNDFDLFDPDLALEAIGTENLCSAANIDTDETQISLAEFANEQFDELLFGLDANENFFIIGDSGETSTINDAVLNYEISSPESFSGTEKRKRDSFDASDETQTGESSYDGLDSPSPQPERASKRARKASAEGKEKKQSNKEAAIRYRQKKTKEKETLFEERDMLEKDNRELKKKIDDMQTEINFVKNILVEMLLKKNILNNVELKI